MRFVMRARTLLFLFLCPLFVCFAPSVQSCDQVSSERRSARVVGEVMGSHPFRAMISDGLFFLLEPGRHGWDLAILDARERDVSAMTPPLRFAPNPRQIYGWHFRNADNSGPNDGSVNAPQGTRLFIFESAPGEDPPDGRGLLTIQDYGLSDLSTGQKARMSYLKFDVCLTWPKRLGAIPPELVEQLGACGLPSAFQPVGALEPSSIGGDFDGDGAHDIAALVRRSTDGKQALAICRAGTWLNLIGLEGDLGHLTPAYFDRMDWWSLYPIGPVSQGVEEGDPPTLKGDAILLGMEEKSSVLLYWTGQAFHAYWQGD